MVPFLPLCLLGGPLVFNDVTFVSNSEQLNGTQRVLLDNVISEEECQELFQIANVSSEHSFPT